MARERHVYPTQRIAGLWIKQEKASARNPQGNFYFIGKTVYSYRENYPVGHIITNTHGTLVLIQDNEYSATTRGHVRGAENTAKGVHPTMRVPRPTPECEHDHVKNLEWMREQFTAALLADPRKRSEWSIRHEAATARCAYNNSFAYARFFGIDTPVYTVRETVALHMLEDKAGLHHA